MLQFTQKVFTLFCLTLFNSIQATPINPQPGENLWYLTAQIGNAIDELSLNQAACCVDIISKIDSLTNIDIILSGTSLCMPLPLTVLPSGTTISTSGVYC